MHCNCAFLLHTIFASLLGFYYYTVSLQFQCCYNFIITHPMTTGTTCKPQGNSLYIYICIQLPKLIHGCTHWLEKYGIWLRFHHLQQLIHSASIMPNSKGRIWELSNLVVGMFAMNGIPFFDQGGVSGLCHFALIV